MWIFYAFLSSILIAITGLFDKLALRSIKSSDSLLIKSIIMGLIMAVIVLLTTGAKSLHTANKMDLFYLLIAGVIGTFAWLTYNLALSSGSLSIVSLIYRSSFVISVLLGIFLLNESFTATKVVGVILSIAGLIFVSL
ncbi:MAG: EamA family transporter [Patescibacteria group bacterium]